MESTSSSFDLTTTLVIFYPNDGIQSVSKATSGISGRGFRGQNDGGAYSVISGHIQVIRGASPSRRIPYRSSNGDFRVEFRVLSLLPEASPGSLTQDTESIQSAPPGRREQEHQKRRLAGSQASGRAGERPFWIRAAVARTGEKSVVFLLSSLSWCWFLFVLAITLEHVVSTVIRVILRPADDH